MKINLNKKLVEFIINRMNPRKNEIKKKVATYY